MKPVIEAGAGTGKTTRIVQIILERVLLTPMGIGQILALTFTVKAANEMRFRLTDWLEKLLAGEGIEQMGGATLEGLSHAHGVDAAQARARAETALHLIDRMEIGTIHSFASHLLRQYPLESGVAHDFAEDEGDAAGALFRELWPAWLARRGDDEATRAILQDALLWGSPAELQDLARELVTSERDWPEAGRADGGQFRLRMSELAAEAASLLARHTGDRRENNFVVKTLPLIQRTFELLASTGGVGVATVREAYRLEDGVPGRSNTWPEPDRAEATHLLKAAQRAILVNESAVLRFLDWLKPLRHEFRGEYRRRGWVGMDGLLAHAARLLRTNPEVRERLKSRFKLILVDEFQDTDPLQGEILLFIAEEMGRFAKHWRDVVVAPGKMIIVGDPKQSIYLFRGADMEAYEAIGAKLGEREAEAVETLGVNHRSAEPIVHFVNAVCGATMRAEAGIQPTYRPLDPSDANRGLPAQIELWLLAESLDAEQHHEIEAEALATWIRSQIDPKEYRNVGILLRALTEAHLYMDAFRRSGIPFAVEGEKKFYGAPEVTDMLNLLGAVADPHNEIALVGLLRSPLGGMRDRELLDLARANALSPFLADGVPGSTPHVRRLYDALLELHKLSRRLDTDRFLDAIVSRIPVFAVEAATYRGEQAVANIRKLIRVMVQVSRDTGATFSDVLKETRRRVRDQEAEGESPLADDQLNAVRILSIHKSKGLEYPVVILPDFSRKAGPEELPVVLEDWAGGRLGIQTIRAATPDWFLLAERYERKREAEWLRVLYVALTRARQTLILSGRTKGAKGTLLGHLLEGLASCGFRPGGAASCGVFEGPGFTLKVRTQIETEKTRAAAPPPAAMDHTDPGALRERWRAREAEFRGGGGPWFGSATGDHEDLGERGSPRAAPEGRSRDRGMLLGTVCHKVLAEIDLRRPMDGLDSLVAAGVRATVPPALGPEIEAEALDILRKFLASDCFQIIGFAEEVHREVPFLIELDGRPCSGQVDVLYRRDGNWYVSDYKTDHAGGAALETFARKYETQKDVYARAVQSSLGLPQPPRFLVVFLRHARAVEI